MTFSKLNSNNAKWLAGITLAFLSCIWGFLNFCHNTKKEPQIYLGVITKEGPGGSILADKIKEVNDTILLVTCLEMRQEDYDSKKKINIFDVPIVLVKDGNRFINKFRYRIDATPRVEFRGNQEIEIPRFIECEDSINYIIEYYDKDNLSFTESIKSLDLRVFVQNLGLVTNGLIDEYQYEFTITQNDYPDRNYIIKNLVYITENVDSFNVTSPVFRDIFNGKMNARTPQIRFYQFKYKAFDFKDEYGSNGNPLEDVGVFQFRYSNGKVQYHTDFQFYYNPLFYVLVFCVVILVYSIIMSCRGIVKSHRTSVNVSIKRVILIAIPIIILLIVIVYISSILNTVYSMPGTYILKHM